MSAIAITGITGGLGQETLKYLSTFAPASVRIVGITRNLASLTNPDPRVEYRSAFAGVGKALIISTSSFDNEERIRQHKNAIDAAVKAQVRRVYYTSLAFNGHEDSTVSHLQELHVDTESYIKAYLKNEQFTDEMSNSGLEYTIIREGLYSEAFPIWLAWFPKTKNIAIPRDGPVAWAARPEIAEGTARLLPADTHKNSIALFTEPTAITLRQVTEVISEILSVEQYISNAVQNAKKDEEFIRNWATSFRAMEIGERRAWWIRSWRSCWGGCQERGC
ncbi:NAD(P)-binding protein [Choiromyces venosus 120613-1]|uniref:NAD(P)-binding protein n=1 Tax=Choiromyces venosus 120613-1 TaxID=1336337 RepID=A0A3N4JSB4_9PEZI|nr:NAD(P)-binding protein [Choiromyces venosus 120613-1]